MKVEKMALLSSNHICKEKFCVFSILSITLMTCIGFHKSTPSKNTFKGVKIGTQIWMTENLNVSTFRNGDAIPEARTAEEWEEAGRKGYPAWCYYNNDPANGGVYGKLYNNFAVNDLRGLAPEGWHIATDQDWTVLVDFLGGEGKVGEKLKSKNGWFKDGNGNNWSGFSARPGGRRYIAGAFQFVGEKGFWWTNADGIYRSDWNRFLDYSNNLFLRFDYVVGYGLSVRCVLD